MLRFVVSALVVRNHLQEANFCTDRGGSLLFFREPTDAESKEIRGPRMSSLMRFARLSPAERRLLLQATCLLGSIRIGLWLLPFAVVQRIALRVGAGSRRRRSQRTTSYGRKGDWPASARCNMPDGSHSGSSAADAIGSPLPPSDRSSKRRTARLPSSRLVDLGRTDCDRWIGSRWLHLSRCVGNETLDHIPCHLLSPRALSPLWM